MKYAGGRRCRGEVLVKKLGNSLPRSGVGGAHKRPIVRLAAAGRQKARGGDDARACKLSRSGRKTGLKRIDALKHFAVVLSLDDEKLRGARGIQKA